MGHASQEALKAARRFVQRKEGRSPLTCIKEECTKGRRVTTDGDSILSYDWWTIAEFCPSTPRYCWVTEERYVTGYWPVSGRPKYSPTTDGHIDAVRQELGRAGFVATETVENRTDNRDYRLWVKE
jgi:hypothetical protein